MPKSITWRLPLSYGAIAFLTMVFFGIVLLVTLYSYYDRQEKQYLRQNAQAVATMTAGVLGDRILDAQANHALLSSQIDSLAYLTQSKIRIFNVDGDLIADSGDPDDHQVAATLSLQVQLQDSGQSLSQSIGRTTEAEGYTTALVIENEGSRFESESSVSGNLPAFGSVEGLVQPITALLSPFNFNQGVGDESGLRSTKSINLPIEAINGELLGYVELSHGPAFGRSILTDVARGLVVAGVIAILLAAIIGWRMSLRLSRPISELAGVTKQMTAGDLSARANVDREDELGQLAGSFNTLAAQIEDTVSALRRFVADAAHEMNTPLTALRTNLDLASKWIRPDRMDKEIIDGAQEQVVRLERLTDDLLRLSRLDAGIGLGQMVPFDLSHFLRGRSERYAAQAEQAELSLHLELPQTSLMIIGDEKLLGRAIGNVVDNAIKFTPSGGDVSVSLQSKDNIAVVFISDTGIGIDEPDLELIFNRFHRGRNAAGYPGSGLGLAISQAIVAAHGGSMAAGSGGSTGTQGTWVKLTLPQA